MAIEEPKIEVPRHAVWRWRCRIRKEEDGIKDAILLTVLTARPAKPDEVQAVEIHRKGISWFLVNEDEGVLLVLRSNKDKTRWVVRTVWRLGGKNTA